MSAHNDSFIFKSYNVPVILYVKNIKLLDVPDKNIYKII